MSLRLVCYESAAHGTAEKRLAATLSQGVHMMMARTEAARSEEALPSFARAPTPAKMAAARNSESAMKNDHASALGGAMPLALQYAAMYSLSLGTPAQHTKRLKPG